MYELLSVASIPFFVLFVAFLCTEIYFIEQEDALKTTASLLIFVALVLIFTDWKPWQTLSFWHTIGYGIAYLSLGVIYAFPRWMLYVKDKCKAFEGQYSELKSKWDADKNVDTSVNWGSGRARYNTFEDMLREQEKMPLCHGTVALKVRFIYGWLIGRFQAFGSYCTAHLSGSGNGPIQQSKNN